MTGPRTVAEGWVPRTRQLQPCGTPAAARRHRRHGEPLCDACLRAHREDSWKPEYAATRKAKRRAAA